MSAPELTHDDPARHAFLTQPLGALIFKNSLPAVISLMMMTAYQVTDGIMVGRSLGHEALAAVNLIYPVVAILVGLAVMLGTGASAYVVRWGLQPGIELGMATGIVQSTAAIANLGPAFYWFTVEAVNAFGAGPASETIAAWGDSPPKIVGHLVGQSPALRLSANLAGASVQLATNLLDSVSAWQTIPATLTTNGSGELEYLLPFVHPHSFFRIRLMP